MLTQEKVEHIVDKIRLKLERAAESGVRLKVTGSSLADEWLYVVVTPAEAGIRASDHADLMVKIERELEQEGDENVLLVPALGE